MYDASHSFPLTEVVALTGLRGRRNEGGDSDEQGGQMTLVVLRKKPFGQAAPHYPSATSVGFQNWGLEARVVFGPEDASHPIALNRGDH